MSNENFARKRRLAENLSNHRAFVDEGDDPHEGDRADAGRVGLSGQLQVTQQQHRDQCRPNLRLDGVEPRTGSCRVGLVVSSLCWRAAGERPGRIRSRRVSGEVTTNWSMGGQESYATVGLRRAWAS